MRRCSPSARDALDLTDVAARRHRSSARGTLRYPANRCHGSGVRSIDRNGPMPVPVARHHNTSAGATSPMLKNPFDLALYLLLLRRLKPRTVIEIGSKSGGSGL